MFNISQFTKRVHLILKLLFLSPLFIASCLEMIYENWFLLFAKAKVVIFFFRATMEKNFRCLFWDLFWGIFPPRKLLLMKFLNFFLFFPVPPEPIWCLDRRESGHLFWRREASKVKFRCEVEVLEFVKDPSEDELILVNGNLNNTFRSETISHPIVVCATCICAIAVTVLLPWFLIGSS